MMLPLFTCSFSTIYLFNKNTRRVFYLFQIQPIGWYICTRPFPVAALNDGCEFLLADLAGAYVEQSTHNRADHTPQKAVGRDRKRQFVTLFLPCGLFDVANKMIYIRFYLAEAFKIMFPQHKRSSPVHVFDFYIFEVMPAQTLQKWILDPRDLIPVHSFDGIITGAGVWSYFPHRLDDNIA